MCLTWSLDLEWNSEHVGTALDLVVCKVVAVVDDDDHGLVDPGVDFQRFLRIHRHREAHGHIIDVGDAALQGDPGVTRF